MQEKLAVVCKFGLGDDFMMNECFFRRATLTYPPPAWSYYSAGIFQAYIKEKSKNFSF